MNDRVMASVRRIAEIKNHPNADKLDIAVVGGWQCVVEKGKFSTGEIVVFCEVDSFVPYALAPFLSKGKEPREYEGVKGERLRSIKLRGELSQGLILPLDIITEFKRGDWLDPGSYVDADVSDLLNINKWERPLNPQLAGQAKGYFPEFLRKTDQERIQNEFGRITDEQRQDMYEVTLKIDGSSMTVFHKDGEWGVCSRNLELKINDENMGNAFIKKAYELDLENKMKELGLNIAIQGELWGSGINGNHEGISHHEFSVFDIFDIDTHKYLTNTARYEICDKLGLQHVPVIEVINLDKFNAVADFLTYAERPSISNKIAEGVVFKSCTNPDYSFKSISNSFLLSGGD